MSYGQPYAPPKPQAGGGGSGVVIIIVIGVLAVLVLATIACLIGMAALLLPAVSAARDAARQTASRNNLMQIGLGIHNYHDVYNTLPAPMLPDKDGRPSISWRVSLLPFIEQTPLFDRYDSNNPWDAPSNAFVRSQRLKIYESPTAGEKTPGKTNYVVVVGQNTAFRPNQNTNFGKIVDGTSNTIFVLEIANSDIEWSEPRDLDLNTLVFAKSAPPGAKNVVVAGTYVLLGDGSTVRLPRELTVEQLKKYLNPSDGEVLPPLGF
jgi:type II secretory pathway pseudopilin PulG